MLKSGEIYREEIPSTLFSIVIWLFMLIAVGFLALLVVQVYKGPIGGYPLPNIFYLLLTMLFLFLAGLLDNFRYLIVSVTPYGITAGYGRFKFTAYWDNIDSYSIDNTSGFFGGWAARARLTPEGWAMTYTVARNARLVLKLKSGRFQRLVLSTRSPDELLSVIERQFKDKPHGLI